MGCLDGQEVIFQKVVLRTDNPHLKEMWIELKRYRRASMELSLYGEETMGGICW